MIDKIRKVWLVKAVIALTILVLLAGAVYAVFNGVIEIIEETLGNIVGFLSNPISFINDVAQNIWNSVAPNLGLNYSLDDRETCMFFLDSEMVDQLAENLSGGGILTENSGYYSGKKKNKKATGKDSQTDISSKIVSATRTTPAAGPGWCLMWVDNVFDRAGVGADRKCCAYKGWEAHHISSDINAIPIGAAVYGTGSGSKCPSCGKAAGHVGIYIGNGQVIDNQISGIVTSDINNWISWQSGVRDGHQGWLGWGWEDGNRTRGLSSSSNIQQASLEEADTDTDNQEEDNSKSKKDTTMYKGALDLEKTGLTKDTVRDMILASYITQATTDTVVGVEIPEDEVDPILKGALKEYIAFGNVPGAEIFGGITNFASKLVKNLSFGTLDFEHKTGNGWAYLKFGNFYYYILTADEGYKYFLAEKGIIQVLDGDGNEAICYNPNTFDEYYNMFNENSSKSAANTYKSKVFYTVPEIGKIRIMSVEGSGDEYSFSTQEYDYANESEIQSAMIPIELLVDFLDISASSDFMSAFEELVKDQEIILRLVPTITTTETITNTTQEAEGEANVEGSAHYDEYLNPTAGGSKTSSIGYDETFSGTMHLGPVTIESHEENTETSITFNLILEKANTWFMKAERDVNKTEYVNGPNTTETEIPGDTISASGDEAFSEGSAGAQLKEELTIENAIDQLGGSGARAGYYLNLQKSTMDVLSSVLRLDTGKKEVTTTTTTETYTSGQMKYTDNTDAFLGLWTNKDGIYHTYKDVFGNENPDALFDPEGKKVGYDDLYNDKKAYVGDLFVNADKMLIELLEMTENTQKHAHTMKYILYRYTGKNYGVTDFDSLLVLLDIKTNSIQNYNVNTKSAIGSKYKIVDTEDGLSAEQNLINGVRSISNSSYRQYCMVYVDRGYCKELIRLQEKYGVNPAWIIAQSYYETQCGTTGSGPAPVNNWWGWDVYGGHTHAFPSPVECFEQICKQLADPSYSGYFQDGNETIDSILDVWCPSHTDEYPTVCKEIFRDILKGAGVKIGFANGDLLKVAEACLEHIQGWTYEQNYQHNTIPLTNNPYRTVDCSSYVSWVLYEYGYTDMEGYQEWSGSFRDCAIRHGWEIIPSASAEAGDVLVKEGVHVELYAGDGMSYNGGQLPTVTHGLWYTSGGSPAWYDFAIRIPEP